jgi:metal-responsive CopG/Arc/MetJ family transcriptional regulator
MQIVERVETTVSLPKDLLEQANRIKKDAEISDVIETALRDYVAKENRKESRKELNRRDIEIINANADKLNEEALDTLEYQQINW